MAERLTDRYEVAASYGAFPWIIGYWSGPKKYEIVARFKTKEEAERKLKQLKEGDDDA